MARAETREALTLLFTSTMLSGLRAGVLCGLAIAGPGGRGTVPHSSPPRRRCTARPAGPSRPAPPLAVALAPPSHPNHDVKGDATPRNVESTFPRRRRRRQRGLPLFLRHYAMVRASQRGLDQSEGRMKELTFIKLSVLSFPFGLTGPRIL